MALATFAVSATAHATCSQGPLGYLIWPKPDATDVPADTPIVVGRYFVGGDTTIVETSLRSADGAEVALEQTRALPPPFVGCGAAETLFLRPAKPLKPGETYTVVNRAGAKTAPFERKFTVSDRVADPQATLSPSVIYLEVYDRPECVHDNCAGSRNVLVDLGEPPREPVWLRLQDSAAAEKSNGWVFYPRGYSDVPAGAQDDLFKIQLGVPVGASAAESCIDIELIGVAGKTLFEEQRCAPDRCAVGGLSFGTSSGGRPGGAVVDIAKVPEGSCDDPPLLNDMGNIDERKIDAGAAAEDDAGVSNASSTPSRPPRDHHKPAANGCSAVRPHASGRGAWLVPFLGLAGFALTRRRGRS